MADPMFVFLVSGTPEKKDDGFARSAWRRVVELVTQLYDNRKKSDAVIKEDSVLRFIHFDCHNSTVGIYEHDFKTMKGVVRDSNAKSVAKNWKTLDENFQTSFGTLDKQHDPKEFVEWQPVRDAKANASTTDKAVSIVNVYHSVRRAPRSSVLELSIFAHAFVDGPVLNNTDATPGSTMRTPGDTDGRALIDFQSHMGEDPNISLGPYQQGQPPPTGGKDARKDFRESFADKGTFRIWGCNIQDIVETNGPNSTVKRRCLILSTARQVIEEAYAIPRKKSDSPLAKLLNKSALPPGNTSIQLDMDRQISIEFDLHSDQSAGHAFDEFDKDRLFEIRYDESFTNHKYHDLFRGERNAQNKFVKVITRTLSDIVKFVASEATGSYVFLAAEGLQNAVPGLQTIPVIGGAPGTSAEASDKEQMHIEPRRVEEAKFFEKFFGASITESGAAIQRRYSRFDNNVVQTVRDREKNGLP